MTAPGGERRPLPFVPYHELGDTPNVIVDGSAHDATILTLSHWPATPTPSGLEADLSVQMAAAYLDRWDLHDGAEAVSNNHFDQDGLTSAFFFVDPDAAEVRRDLLVDVGSAGDFATFERRDAARVSMTIAAFADPDRTPLDGPTGDDAAWCGVLYGELLGRLPELCDHPERFGEWWADEDAAVDHSLAAIESGAVSIEEVPGLDLAVVTIATGAPTDGGHRFASQRSEGLHPMAVNGATSQFSTLTQRGRTSEFAYRYESWVQYRSRRPRPRVDLAPLAERLNDDEHSGGQWIAEPPRGLTPRLYLAGAESSSIDPADFRRRLEQHLATAPPAWDPYPN